MNERKLSLTITSLTLLMCILFSFILYSVSKSVVGNDFQNNMITVIRNIDTAIDEINKEKGSVSPNECAKIISDNQIIWHPYSNSLQYPFTFAIFDSNGNIVEKYGYCIYTDDEYLNIDEYMTDDIINKFKSTFANNGSGVSVDKFSYYENGGKKIVTKITFYDFNTDKTLDVTLNDYEGKTITKTNIGRFDEENSTSIDFDFSKMYQNRQNRKIQQKIDKEVQSNYNTGETNYYGSEKASQCIEFKDGKNKYTAYYIYQYDTFLFSSETAVFQSGIQFLCIIFVCVSTVLSFVFCKIFRKQKELTEAREAFTSGAAHELKTPITIINNQCECLIKNVSPEKNGEYISSIYRQNKHMASLVGKLLQYNRIGKDTLNKTKFDIEALAKEEIEKYKALANQNEIIIETSLESKTIYADRNLIKLVIDNFLSNAIKNTKKGDKIRISFDSKKFSVFNEGKPIDDKISRKIWEVFTKSEDNDIVESHGMGLATCKKILELHKFKYGYLNRLSGVEFYFEIK